MMFRKLILLPFLITFSTIISLEDTQAQRLNVLVLYEGKGHHVAFTDRAIPWLKTLTTDSNFHTEFITDPGKINKKFLRRFDLFIQLDYVPYGWNKESAAAFEHAITTGSIGWLGLHHATLLGEFDGYPMWNWFSKFMGNIKYKNYIADFASASVQVENKSHPAMRGIPDSFFIAKEEWYIYNQSPRPNVQVLATVNENTYYPDSQIKMGDHPVIWSNPNMKAKNIYIFMGHSPELFDNTTYCTLLKNAISWAGR